MRFIIPLVIIATVFTYIGWHTWMMLPLPRVWKSVIIAMFVILFLLLPITLLAENHMAMPVSAVLDKVSTAWLIALLYLIIAFILVDITRLCFPAIRPLFIANWRGVAVVVFGVISILIYGNINYFHKVRVPLNISIDKPLSRTYKIVFISDLHLGYTIGTKELAQWVDLINAEHPDIILIGGDIVDYSCRPVAGDDFASLLRHLNASQGVYCCLGNHDYYAGEPRSEQFYRESGITLLRDSSAVINGEIVVIGRDDRTNSRRPDVGRLVKNFTENNKDAFTILLDHQPYHLEEAEQAGVDFQFSGHTHYGQVWPISWVEDLMYECAFGEHRRGQTRYYVSSGIGIWGGKFRIGTRSEYIVATIK